jgi:hypothetical protein
VKGAIVGTDAEAETLSAMSFRRGYFVVPNLEGAASPFTPLDNEKAGETIAASVQAELMKLGFMFDEASYARLKRVSKRWAVAYYNEVLPVAKEVVGAKRGYRPFYTNFPQQVMEMSTAELYVNAMLHYWSEGTWEPDQNLTKRGVAFESVEFRPVRLISEDDFKQLFTKLVSLNISLTEADKKLVDWFVRKYGRDLEMPPAVPFKETLCLLASHGLDVPVKTTTDVLRIATYVSGGDIALPAVPKPKFKQSKAVEWRWAATNRFESALAERAKWEFKNFSRPDRKYLLGLLEKTNLDTSEMQQRLERWLRLGERLHPGEYRKQLPKTYAAFVALRNQPPKIRSYFAQIDMAVAENDLNKVLELLAKRPGELARRLDWLMRKYELSEDVQQVFDTFEAVAGQVSSRVLFELYDHLQRRTKPSVRSIATKRGSKVKTLVPLPPLKEELVSQAQQAVLRSLGKAMKKLPSLGTVSIDERLKEVPLPTAMRSMNTGIRTYVRGTRIPFRNDARVIRPFIHWFDEHGQEDIDLSAGFLREDFVSLAHVSYTNLREPSVGAVHSGDVRHRKGSCAEYVDIEIQQALGTGVRYVTFHAFNFNARPLHSIEECVFGLMEREHPRSNEIFEPKSVSNSMPLANESTSVMICAVDLLDRSYIWLDIETDRQMAAYENIRSSAIEALKSIVEGGKLTAYDLLRLHAEARGSIVTNRNTAETEFKYEDFVMDYAKLASYLSF